MHWAYEHCINAAEQHVKRNGGRRRPKKPTCRKQKAWLAGQIHCQQKQVERLLYTQTDDTVAMADGSHRDRGLWAVDSLNPNCWRTGLEYARESAPDILFMQETRLQGGDQAREQEDSARVAG